MAAASDEIRFLFRSSEFGWLSNLYDAGFELDGLRYRTVEHYFQASKFPEDADRQAAIRAAASGGAAKALGRPRKDVPFDREKWDAMRCDVMLRAMRAKFAQNADLGARLVATGSAPLIENNLHDKFWGCGRGGTGKNMTGVLLMRVREELRAGSVDHSG